MRPISMRHLGYWVMGLSCGAAACGGGAGSEVSGSGSGVDGAGAAAASGSGASSGNGTGASNSGGGSQGKGGSLVIDVGGSSAGGTAGSQGDGTPELCDGEDNDSNGIIDDVDAGGDGVCDCLNIATIGHIGPWSNGGNIFSTWLNARSPLGAKALGDQELTAERLQGLQVIVVLHAATTAVENKGVTAPALHTFSAGEAAAFDAWVRAGGGVMTTIGYTNDEANEVVNVNRILAPLGMAYSTSKLGLSGDIQTWMPHAVTDGISNIFTDNGVEPDTATGSTVAQGGDSIALQVQEVGSGRVAVWGDEWITYDSEWADVDGQQVELFWLNLLKWLSPPTECQVPIPPRVK